MTNGTFKGTRPRASLSMGMTNGLGGGFTNGAGKANQVNQSHANGAGLTNSTGRSNGLTNGLNHMGGLTNGLGGGRFNRQGAAHPKTMAAIIVVIFIAILPVLFFLLAEGQSIPGQAVSVDGSFNDWDKMTKYADASVCADTQLDVTEFAIAFDDADFFAYLQVQDDMSSRASVDRYFVFIDADGSAATGYLSLSLGAEYVVEAYLDGGSWQVSANGFSGEDQSNWSAFKIIGSGHAESRGAEMEMKASIGAELNVGGALRVRFATMCGSAVAEVCAPIVDGRNGALVIVQAPQDSAGIVSTSSLLELRLMAVGKDITVNSLTVDATVNSMTIASQGVLSINQAGFTAGTIPVNTAIPVHITGDVASLADGTLVKAGVTFAAVTDATYNVVGNGLAAYAKAAPSAIAIDGAFADWNAIPKTADAASDVANPNIDIIEDAATTQSNNFLAYVKFNGVGRAMAGTAIPSSRAAPVSGGGGSGGDGSGAPVILPRVSGEDVTRFYIDSVSGGYSIGGISADYMLEIRGKDGAILSKNLYTYPARALVASVSAENGAGAIEASVPLAQIGSPAGAARMVVETTDWERKSDSGSATSTALVSGAGTRADPEPVNLGTAGAFIVLACTAVTNTGATTINGNLGVSPAGAISGFPLGTVHGTIHLNDATASLAQADLTAAYNDAAGRTAVTIATELGGTSPASGVYDSAAGTFGITGTLTLNGDANAVWIFQAASTLNTAASSQVVLSGGARACNVFWTVGSSATLLGVGSNFKGNILAQTSITVSGGAILEGRALAQTGAITLDTNKIAISQSAVVVNEVMFDSVANPDWFELHNPAASSCDVSGWSLVDGTDLAIFTYPAATSLASGGYDRVDVGTPLGLSDQLALVDANGTLVDFVAWGTSSPSGTYYQAAVDTFNWQAGQYVDTAGFIQENTIGRDMDSTDANAAGDWEITCGIDAGAPTPDEQNVPEFPVTALPIIMTIAPLAKFWKRKSRRA